MKPRLLDLFCGAGGCTKGYQEAGFEVVGVDLHPQPNYCGDHFTVADAIEYLSEWGGEYAASHFSAIHASPPCPLHSTLNGWSGDSDAPELIAPTRELLEQTGLPYVIENVPGAPLKNAVRICGQALGLKVRRHRYFETNWPVPMFSIPPCHHPGPPVIVIRGAIGRKVFDPRRKAIAPTLEEAKEVMEMPWAETAIEVCNAIPPAYTKLIGEALMTHLNAETKVAA